MFRFLRELNVQGASRPPSHPPMQDGTFAKQGLSAVCTPPADFGRGSAVFLDQLEEEAAEPDALEAAARSAIMCCSVTRIATT